MGSYSICNLVYNGDGDHGLPMGIGVVPPLTFNTPLRNHGFWSRIYHVFFGQLAPFGEEFFSGDPIGIEWGDHGDIIL